MNAEDVAKYLQENPIFFEDYADLLSQMYIPHPHGEHAIPLSDRQVITLREKNRALEAKLAELIQFGEENDVISEKVHRLVLAMLPANDLQTLVNTIHLHLREDFAVPHAALRLWKGAGEGGEFAPVSDELKDFAQQLTQPFCGPNANFEAVGWFADAAPHVRSVAFMPLAELDVAFGMLALGSEDLLRFYPEMGTLYLKRIGELAGAALARFL